MKHSMRTKSVFAITASVIAVSLSLGTAANASDSDQRTSLTNNSLFKGVALDGVNLLHRKEGPGARLVAMTIASEMASLSLPSGPDQGLRYINEQGMFGMVDTGTGAYLKVYGDGTRVRYSDSSETRPDDGVEVEDRIPDKRLYELGRKFINDELVDVIDITSDDEVVDYKTMFQLDSEFSEKEATKQRVTQNTAVFSRRVRGTDVVGAGSKIAIMFANDGSIEGFFYDWPEYEQLEDVQSGLSPELARERASQMSSLRVGAQEVELKRFECGLMDEGMSDDIPNRLLQLACDVQYVGWTENSDGSRTPHARADIIPIADTFIRSGGWTAGLKVPDQKCIDSDLGKALPH
ncbi:MAG: hypothetical protein V3W44_05635 [Dehalococcoidales bacterium]